MAKLIEENLKTLELFDKQRKQWLKLSAFVCIAVIAVIVDWNHIKTSFWGWIAVSFGLVLCVIWWYWTMGLIKRILIGKKIESEILISLVNDIREIKSEVKKNNLNY